jgi:hypothetical protein
MSFPVTITETAGTGVNINFVRLEVRWTDRADYIAEVGAADVIAVFGTNHINGNSSLSGIMWFIVPLREDLTGMRLTFGMTDDYGNDKTETGATGSLALEIYNRLAASAAH